MPTVTGIILAGGEGTRLWPLTASISKQLLPVCDKPMIFYSVSILILSGVKKIIIITKTRDLKNYKSILNDGSQWGVEILYVLQDEAKGIPDAIMLCKSNILAGKIIVCLGDNIFHGSGLVDGIKNFIMSGCNGAKLFLKKVKDPRRFGVAVIDDKGKVISLQEKPMQPKSSLAITGIYGLDCSVFEKIPSLNYSKRGELEMVDLLNLYNNEHNLSNDILGRGISWLDTGTPKSLLAASNFIDAIQETSGDLIGCPEEAAYNMGLIDKDRVLSLSKKYVKSEYRENLSKIC